AAVRGIEASEKPIAEIEPVPVAALPEGAITPVSCAVTYPRRKQDYSFLAKAEYSCVVSASLSVVVFTAGDEMVIRCIQKSDTHVHAEAIAAVLSEAGISAEAVDRGYLEGDILRTGMLKRI
ncbi:MAG: hypothetical protein IJT32_04780, partial [Lachnospiraceae bacterium]|nr:hypothetical protein [Lachnospiraceae bacterium]